jgi:hypothetical protein
MAGAHFASERIRFQGAALASFRPLKSQFSSFFAPEKFSFLKAAVPL